jgi:arrestin-2
MEGKGHYITVCALFLIKKIYINNREEDETMGLKFSKELIIGKEQIYPMANDKMEMTPMQERLIKKLGKNAFPLTFQFPQSSPTSVTLQPGEDDTGKPLGVEYYIKVFVGDNDEDKVHKRSSVTLIIKKLQYAPPTRGNTHKKIQHFTMEIYF